MNVIPFVHAMDLKALRYFIETVRRQSFTEAALALHVTQSTVSKMVRQLEDEVGQPLVWRGPGRLTPTDAGRIVFERGQEAMAVMQGLERELDDLGDLRRGSLTVGIPPMVNVFFSPLIQRFRAQHPGIALELREAGGDVIGQMVADGELEVGVGVLPLASAGAQASAIETALLGRYPVCLLATRDAAWTRLKRPTLASLHGQPVVMPGAGFALARLLRERWQRAGVQPQVVAESSQWDFLVSMAQAGMGTAILPEPLLQRLQLGTDLEVRRLPAAEMEWAVAHIWAKGRYMSGAGRAWLASCRGP